MGFKEVKLESSKYEIDKNVLTVGLEDNFIVYTQLAYDNTKQNRNYCKSL